jgi:prepilin-type N-terminal cleavage/methylation domain-containing protein
MRSRGFTLPEVIVGMALLVLLGALLVNIYTMCLAVYRQGTARLELQQQAREFMRRIGPVLDTAVPPPGLSEAIYSPTIGNSGTTVYFATTQNLIDPTKTNFNPRQPTYDVYDVTYNAADQQIILEATYSPTHFEVLAQGVYACQFDHLDEATVKVTMGIAAEVREAGGKTVTQSYPLQTVIELPYYTAK